MKKLAFILAFIMSLTLMSLSLTCAVQLPLRVVVDGDKLTFPDAQPFIDQNNRTQTPAKFIGEALGAKVTWDSIGRRAIFVSDGIELILYIGKKEYTLNGQKKLMDTAAIIKDDRTFVPAKYIAESFGASVEWDSSIKTVYITTGTLKTGTKTVAGFEVPLDYKLLVFKPVGDDRVDATFVVDFLNPNFDKQIVEVEKLLSQKCDSTTVKQVINHIKQKKSRWDELPEEFIFDNKSKRYIWIKESRSSNIDICYLTEETSKKYANN
ncbi:copper amine oxidase N-terminal domain-containing protein [Ruminiclostridium herbifermentans]|uniref:Copper amine oxidase N-terminal domain-containing protein n=1 Tax=Ruminiclostridium herbifermentans TaxID=2488810 RepID=A0A4U7JCG9_9FIRM|nr:copper amine oxidase N-terminal domain-containing protein [Ruminiclostridium herbifermentans]QNU67816.1 copper amine oxidase N-terminal domain-containing protein [Ruminiclostridium herbifermentans]